MMDRHVYLFDYTQHPYGEVRDLLRDDPARVLAPATEEAHRRRSELVASLGVEVGGIELARTIGLELEGFTEQEKPWPICKLELRWRAVGLPAAFPSMEADLEAYGLSEEETQVSFLGRYRPPLGPIGGLADAMGLHRVADASLHRFFASLMEELDRALESVRGSR